jgi:hypothetical protein
MPRLSYANVTATLALFLALGATSVAATNLISGSKIKKASIPADRLKPRSLGAGQVNVVALGTVPAALHAGSADTAGSATHADTATRAGDADTVGGFAPSKFLPASRVLAGSANTNAGNTQVFFDSPLGFRLETDGVPGYNQSVNVRNTGTSTLGLIGPASVIVFDPGEVHTVSGGPGYFGATSEAHFIVQRASAPTEEAFVTCYFPSAGTGAIQAMCTAVQTA